MRFPHRGADLLFGVLQVRDGIARRRHPARAHDLDLGGAAPKLLARGAADLGDPVRDGREVPRPEPARAQPGPRLVAAEVPMPAGLAEGMSGVEQARAGDQAGLDCTRKPVVGTGRVAHRREPALQGRFQIRAGVLREQRGGHVLDGTEVGTCGDGVEVRVDQPGHQGAALEIDDFSGPGSDGNIRHLHDPAPLDQHLDAFERLFAHAVEDPAMAKQSAHASRSLVAAIRSRHAGDAPIPPAARSPPGPPNPRRRSTSPAPLRGSVGPRGP